MNVRNLMTQASLLGPINLRKLGLLPTMLSTVALALLPTITRAQNFVPTSGNFKDGSNWDTGSVPGGVAFIGPVNPDANQTATLDSSTHTVSFVYIGHPTGSATLNVSDVGSLTVAGLYLGVANNAAGTVNQSGGTVNVTGEFRMVDGSTGNSAYNLSGGTLEVNGVSVVVGYSGSGVGTFNLSGGTLTGAGSSGMTINSGSILNDSGGTFSLGGVINNGTINYNNAGGMTRSSPISGAGTVSKAGAGELVLSGGNSYSGGTTIHAGSIRVEHTNALGTGSLTMDRGVTLVVGASGTLANAIALGSSGGGDQALLRVATNAVLSGDITSTAPAGSKLLAYAAPGTSPTGAWTFKDSTISLGSTKFYSWTPGVSNKSMSDDHVTAFDNVNFSTLDDFQQAGSKVRVLAGTTMTIGGQLTSLDNWSQFEMATGSTVNVAGGIDFAPNAGVVATGLAFNGGTLITPYIYGSEYDGQVNTLFDGTTVVAGADTTDFLRVRLDGNTSAIHGGSAKVGNNGLIFDTAGYAVTISNALANAAGAIGSLTKQGNGTLTLAASNSYTGATTVDDGILVISNSNASFTATIQPNSVDVDFTTPPDEGTYAILPGPLNSASLASVSVTGLAAGKTATVANSPNLVIQVAAAPAGPTFESAYPANSLTDLAPNGLTYLMNYAFGGSSSHAATLPSQDFNDPTKLTLVAFVRTNNTGGVLSVVGEAGDALSNFDSTKPIPGEFALDQSDAPAGTEKRIFSVPANGDRLFLRLKATLTP